jgi:F0F1-type ATP synthase membrane subunit b/b'
VGYRAIKEEAANIAERRAKEKVAEYMDSQAIHDRLKEEVRARVKEEADTLYRDSLSALLSSRERARLVKRAV